MSHYASPEVLNEIQKFLENRIGVAICKNVESKVMLSDIPKLSNECQVYGSLMLTSGYATPCIAIEFDRDVFALALETAKIISDFVYDLGVKKSLYIVWTGRWLEIRIHELAFPSEFFKEISNPVIAASLISEYILSSLRDKLMKISFVSSGRIKVINAVSREKLIAPLSIVDSMNVAIYVTRDLLDDLTLDSSSISNPMHSKKWNDVVSGEARELANLVIEAFRKGKVKAHSFSEIVARGGTLPKIVGRFEVMALLQAVRYYLLTGDMEKAKSFGLNRAIFYAWLKYHGSRRWRVPQVIEKEKQMRNHSTGSESTSLGIVKDGVEVGPRGWFTIGGQEQTPTDFDKQVRFKFETFIPFEVVWRMAVNYVKQFPESVLRDPNKFFKYVYEPVRDNFIEKVILASHHQYPKASEAQRLGVQSKKAETIVRMKQKSLTSFLRGKVSEDSSHH
ncbi:MAG TPA: hypothetical protein EYH02_01745 [Ignisphaera aggregans]|uniref:Uncharacterized protein n=1 Tax=Ignisphaera aggregans TaxID=334771 RepID=A0A833DSZ0_9CREN|nr:hypothetical protein [Ignisphaera aggregans]